MPPTNSQPANLKAGEFYGFVPQKRYLSSAILSEVVHKNAVSVPHHSHELAYFTLVIDGGYEERFAGKTQFYEPRSILWHQPGISHKDRIGKTGGHFFTVEVQKKSLENLNLYAKTPEDFSENNGFLTQLGYRLYQEFKNWQLCSSLIVEGITLEMLGQAARRQTLSEKSPPAWLLRVIEKLNEEFTENFSTEQIASDVDVHPVHLAAVFRRFYQITLGEYVQRLRVNQALKLLLDKELPLAEIALLTGFSDQSHFTRIFKRYVGITPGAFRNSPDRTPKNII